MQKAQGYVEQGNLVVTVGGVSAAQKSQGSYPQATVAIYNAGTLVLATIYSDNSSTPKANPFTASTTGYFFFYAANGRYDITFSGGGLSAPLTFGDFLLADPFASGGAVTSFNGRTGAVVPIAGDYSARLISSLPEYYAYDYIFTQLAPAENLSPVLRTVTMIPVPLGINGADVNHYVGIYNNAGTWQENALINGGSAVSGASSGTVTFTSLAGTYATGAYKIGTATAGIQEACQVIASPGGLIIAARGTSTLYAPVHPPYQFTIWIAGQGRSATVMSVAAGFPTSVDGVFIFSPSQVTATAADSGGLISMTIGFIQPDSTNVGTYTHWPPAVYIYGNNHVAVSEVIIERAWDAITSPLSTNGVTIDRVGMSFFHRGITIDLCVDLLDISRCEAWVFGLTSNQSTAFRAVATNNYALDIQQCDYGWIDGFISDAGKFCTFHKNGSGGVPVLHMSNIDMDTNGGFEMSNGYVRMTNVNVSLLVNTVAFSISGGTLAIDGVSILNSGSLTAYFTYNPSAANAGAAAGLMPGLSISGLHVSASTEDNFVIYATSSAAFAGVGVVQLRGGFIAKSPGQAYLNVLFAEVAGTGSVVMDISHVKIASNGGTAAPAFSFGSSLAHTVSFCDGPGGWSYTIPTTTRWFNNSGFTSNFNLIPLVTKITARTSVATMAALQAPNYIATETGANNAIASGASALVDAAGVDVPLATGLRVLQLLAHSLQAGANTYNYNNGGAVAIKSARNPANNMGTAMVALGWVDLLYDSTGPYWLNMGQ